MALRFIIIIAPRLRRAPKARVAQHPEPGWIGFDGRRSWRESDEEALWRFSTAFYDRAEVAEALIKLQDRAGFDVNLMLFALWFGLSGRNRCTAAELAAADRAAGPIRGDLVEPLRALRRRLRSNPDADIQRLRAEIKRLELAAERILQNRLARIAGTAVGDNDPASRVAAAEANLALYLGPETAGSAEAATIREALRAYVHFDR